MIDETKMALAVDWVGQSSLVGFYASEKMNGVRAYWDGKTFWARSGIEIKAPEWLTCDMPELFPLDGEIHCGRGVGRGNENTAYKVAMTAVVQGGKWWDETCGEDQIRFTAFDTPISAGGNWLGRITTLPENLRVGFTIIESPKHLVEYMMELKRVGAEGAMFRNPDEIGYHAGRTGSLLRWKF